MSASPAIVSYPEARGTGFRHVLRVIAAARRAASSLPPPPPRRFGRIPYSTELLLAAYIAGVARGVRSPQHLARALREDEQFSGACGFERGRTPSEGTLVRFWRRLKEDPPLRVPIGLKPDQ